MANFIQKAIGNFILKSLGSVNVPLTSNQFFPLRGFQWGKSSPTEFLTNAYGGNPYVFMIVNRLCEKGSSLERVLVDKNNPDKEIRDINLEEILKQPNKKESFDELLYRMGASYLVTGECFLFGIEALGFGTYGELISPINSNVTINERTDGSVINYSVNYFGKIYTVEPENMLHIFRPDIISDSNRGLSSLHAGKKVYQSNNEIWENEAELHKNAGISGVLYRDSDRPMPPTEQQGVQSQFDKDFTGSKSRGKVRIDYAKWGFLQLGMNSKDLESIKGRQEHLRAICALFNVAPELYGDPSQKTYNNVHEAKISEYTDAIFPLYDNLLKQISEWLIQGKFKMKDVYLKIDKDAIEILHTVNKEKSDKVVNEFNAGIINRTTAQSLLYDEGLIIEDIVVENVDKDFEDNPQAMSANEQAQATLRGSVGGVQGILSIQASFANGITNEASAVAILMEIYGFEENVARQILGL